jgi:hypothetical protein
MGTEYASWSVELSGNDGRLPFSISAHIRVPSGLAAR